MEFKDRFDEIKARYWFVNARYGFVNARYGFVGTTGDDIAWLVAEVERLREAAHVDQVTIQRLRREVNEWSSIYAAAEAKLSQTLHRAASRAGRVPR